MWDFLQLAASPAPYLTASRPLLLIWVIGPPIVAFLLFKILKKMGVPAAKWIALIPCVIGVIVGIQGIMLANDPLAESYFGFGERSKMIFYAIPVISAISAGLIFLVSRAKGDDYSSRL